MQQDTSGGFSLASLAGGIGWLNRRRLTLLAAVLLALIFYGAAYWTSPERPDGSADHPTLGWWAWFDQGQYYQSVKALQRNDFTPAEHWYPIGYPLVGTLFYPIMPLHPFLIPNLLCFFVICAGFMWICQMIVSPGEALLLCFFAVIWPATLRDNIIRPWTNTPVSAALMILAYLALAGRRDRFPGMATGACAAIIFMMRPGDLLYSWPIMTALWFGSRDWRDALRRAGWFAAGATPLGAISLFYSVAIHGNVVSELYRRSSELVGFGFASLGIKLYTFFIDGFPFFGESRTLVTVFPFLLVVLPGAVVFVQEFKWKAGVVIATQAGAFLYFLAYNDFWIANLFRYGAIRYWLWIVPFCCLYSYMTIRFAWRKLGWIKTAVLILIPLLTCTVPRIGIRPARWKLLPSMGPAQPSFPDALARDQRQSGWVCQAGSGGSCGTDLAFVVPVSFDILKLQGVFPPGSLNFAIVWVDNQKNQNFHDFIAAEGPNAQYNLIFYGRKRGKSVRLLLPAAIGNEKVLVSGVGLAERHVGLALRNPFKVFHPDQR